MISRGTKFRVLTLMATVAMLGGTAFVASGSTGAYFSDTHAGGIAGSIGKIAISPTTSTNISFSNLVPGTAQTVTVDYTNTGTVPQDVWVTFPNATALSSLNNLGHYGSVTVASSGWGSPSGGVDFTTTNLDDNSALDACGPLSPAGCWPLPDQVKLASNVPVGASGTFSFTFEYAPALNNTPATTWNDYPLPGDNGLFQTYAACETYYQTNPLPTGDTTAHQACSDNQVTINAADGTSNGLPFQLVATQVGITPGQVGTKF